MRSKYWSPAVFLFLLAASFATYYAAMADMPRWDHTLYLADRAFVDTDWDWFWHTVSYSRTRHLAPGDHYLFRPLHMAVLALKDIYFRSNLLALGAINICFMAVAGFSLYRFARCLAGTALAVALALLFMVQYAGIEIVAYGHISPYLMALACFGFAMTEILKGGPGSLTRAAVLFFVASLFHEMIIVTLVLTALAALFVRWRAGSKAEVGGTPIGKYLIWVLALPIVVYLGLDLFDYVYRGMPSLLGPGDVAPVEDKFVAVSSLFLVPGAAAIAFAAPFLVKLSPVHMGIHTWNFSELQLPVLIIGIVLTIAAICALGLCIRSLLRGRGPNVTMSALMIIFMFAGTTLGIGIGRVIISGIQYFYSATYYYSITAYLFCLLTAIGVHYLSGEESLKRIARGTVMVLVLLLVAVNFIKARHTLQAAWPEKKEYVERVSDYKELLGPQADRYCFAGSDKTFTLGIYGPLLRDYFCLPGDTRTPGYVTTGEDNALWLSNLKKLPFGSVSETREVSMTLHKGVFLLSHYTYNKPDLALRMQKSFNGTIVLGYQDPMNYLMFVLRGPLVSSHIMKDGRIIDIQKTAVPSLGTEYRVEVRHAGDDIYIFVDDYVMAAIPDAEEKAGKVGLVIWEPGGPHGTYSDFMATKYAGGGSFTFEPYLKLSRGNTSH